MHQQLVPIEMLDGEYLFRRYGASLEEYEHAATEDSRIELIDEMLVMHAPASERHEDLFRFLVRVIDGYAEDRRLGKVYGSRMAMILGAKRRFEPDLAFVRLENLGRVTPTSIQGPADLIIEILSPATRDYDLNEKRRAYADGGVPEYWMIDPDSRRLFVDRPAGRRHAELTEGVIEPLALPGLRLDVSWLWQEPLPLVSECMARLDRM